MSESSSTSRRAFLAQAVAAGGAVTLGLRTRARAQGPAASPSNVSAAAPRPLRILILGGTGFSGPDQVRYALARGHHVTVFNRGKTHPGILPTEVEQLLGDRNGHLEALQGRDWDVCIDNPTTLPVWVRDAAKILQGHVERYIFTSTISVYADNALPDQDETAPLAKYTGADAMAETLQTLTDSKFALYGPLKALSEAEAEKWFPGKTLVIRPGLIVGPGDESDRFTYWPVRLARGGRTVAPGAPTDPVQFIDARDLAEWTIRQAEAGTVGIFNATGPAKSLEVGAMLAAIQHGIGSDAELVWMDADFLAAQKVAPWSDLPVWIPPTGEDAGFTRRRIARALERGLTFRPVADTARDTLAWFRSQPPERQAKLHAGLSPEREAAVLAAWDARAKQAKPSS